MYVCGICLLGVLQCMSIYIMCNERLHTYNHCSLYWLKYMFTIT